MTCRDCKKFNDTWPDGSATYGQDIDHNGETQRKGLCEKYWVWVREDMACAQWPLFSEGRRS